MNRRSFMGQLGTTVGGAMFLPKIISSLTDQITFGLMADPHADLVPDHMSRLEKFMLEVDVKKPDFILQLGDFCFPKKENAAFLDLWNQYDGPKYHVLGNHDMDISSKEVIIDFLGMPSRYYSFDHNELHVIVLDANNIRTESGSFTHYDTANFYIDSDLRTFIDPPQIEWFEDDLKRTQLPTLVFSHQSLSSPCWGVKNRLKIQRIMENKNADETSGKVIACFNGHDHIDYHREINGIHYLEINSMAYQWLGEKYSNKTRYSEELHQAYPSLDKIAPYQDSLFTFVTVDLDTNMIFLTAKESSWLEPSPKQLGALTAVEGCQNSPSISERKLSY